MPDEEKTEQPTIRRVIDQWGADHALAVPSRLDTEMAFDRLELLLLRYFEHVRNQMLGVPQEETRIPPRWVTMLKAVRELAAKAANGRDDQQLLKNLDESISRAERGLLRPQVIKRCYKCQRILPPRSILVVCHECHNKLTHEQNPHVDKEPRVLCHEADCRFYSLTKGPTCAADGHTRSDVCRDPSCSEFKRADVQKCLIAGHQDYWEK